MIDRIVLDVELTEPELLPEPAGPYEGCEPGVQTGPWLSFDWQKLAVPPQVGWTRGNEVSTQLPGDRIVVKHHLEGSQAFVADVQCLRRERRLANRALQTSHVAHCQCAPQVRTGIHNGGRT